MKKWIFCLPVNEVTQWDKCSFRHWCLWWEISSCACQRIICLETLAVVLMKFNSDGIWEYDEIVCALIEITSYSYALTKLDSDVEN